MTKLLIQNGNQVYIPIVEDSVKWVTERTGTPGELTFSVLNDKDLNITEGNLVRFEYKGKKVFTGFIFDKSEDRDGVIDIVAYDQLRYLKNKDTYVYTNRRADQLVRMISDDFGLQVGTLENTRYTIPKRIEDNVALYDMIGNALDLTLENTGQQYILYDDFGKLALRRMQSMALDVLVDASTAENFKYSSSIDKDTYNKIKLSRDNEEKGTREIFISQDSKNMNQWGILQFYDTLSEDENGRQKAEALLRLYNAKTRTLEVMGQLGDTRVRGGSMLPVGLELSDTTITNMMMVEKCTHTFSRDEHFMDLRLWGGEFSA